MDGRRFNHLQGFTAGADGEGVDALRFEELADGHVPAVLLDGEEDVEAGVVGDLDHELGGRSARDR